MGRVLGAGYGWRGAGGGGGCRYLPGGVRLLVAGQDLEDDAAAGVAQAVLQRPWVAAHLPPVHLPDDVPDVQQPLLCHHAPVQDAGDDQFPPFHPERHPLGDTAQRQPYAGVPAVASRVTQTAPSGHAGNAAGTP